MKDLQCGHKLSLVLQTTNLAWSRAARLLQDKVNWNVWFADDFDRFNKEPVNPLPMLGNGWLFVFDYWVKTHTPCGTAKELKFEVEAWLKGDNDETFEVWIPNVWVSCGERFSPVMSVGYRWKAGKREEFGFVDFNALVTEAIREMML